MARKRSKANKINKLVKKMNELEAKLSSKPRRQRRRRRTRPAPVAPEVPNSAMVQEGVYPEGAMKGISMSKLEPHEQGFIQGYCDPCGEKNLDMALARIPDGAVTNSLAWAHRDQLNLSCPFPQENRTLTNPGVWTLTLIYPPFMTFQVVAVATLQAEITDDQRLQLCRYLSGSIVILDEWVQVRDDMYVQVHRAAAMKGKEWRDDARDIRMVNRGFTALLNAPTLVNQGRVVAAQFATDVVKSSVVEEAGDYIDADFVIWTGSSRYAGLVFDPPSGVGARIVVLRGFWVPRTANANAVENNGTELVLPYPPSVATNTTTDVNDHTKYSWSSPTEIECAFDIDINRGRGSLSRATTYYVATGLATFNGQVAWRVTFWDQAVNVGTNDDIIYTYTRGGDPGVTGTSTFPAVITQYTVGIQPNQSYVLPPTSLSEIVQGTPQSIQQLARCGDGVYMPLRQQEPVWNFALGIESKAIRVLPNSDMVQPAALPGAGDIIDNNFMSGIVVFSDISVSATIWLKVRGMLELVAEGHSMLAPTMAKTEPKSEEAVAIVREVASVLPHAFPASYNCLGAIGGLISQVIGKVPILGNVTKILGKVVGPLLSNLIPKDNAGEHDFTGHEEMMAQMMQMIGPLMQQFMQRGNPNVFRNLHQAMPLPGMSTKPMM